MEAQTYTYCAFCQGVVCFNSQLATKIGLDLLDLLDLEICV